MGVMDALRSIVLWFESCIFISLKLLVYLQNAKVLLLNSGHGHCRAHRVLGIEMLISLLTSRAR